MESLIVVSVLLVIGYRLIEIIWNAVIVLGFVLLGLSVAWNLVDRVIGGRTE